MTVRLSSFAGGTSSVGRRRTARCLRSASSRVRRSSSRPGCASTRTAARPRASQCCVWTEPSWSRATAASRGSCAFRDGPPRRSDERRRDDLRCPGRRRQERGCHPARPRHVAHDECGPWCRAASRGGAWTRVRRRGPRQLRGSIARFARRSASVPENIGGISVSGLLGHARPRQRQARTHPRALA